MALHGGPVAALVARGVELHAGSDDLQLARITLELHSPGPRGPADGEEHAGQARTQGPAHRHRRRGRRRRGGLVESAAHPGGRRAPLEPTVPEDDAPRPPELGYSSASMVDSYRAFHNEGMEMRYVSGSFEQPGPATVWFRLRCPVVLG